LGYFQGSILKYRGGPNYIGERRKTFAKAYRIKVRCYGEHVGEHIEKWGTYWEPDGNPLGTKEK
jgi:hypothetical protein